jgi:chromosomal replication initiation ATPase DnaA
MFKYWAFNPTRKQYTGTYEIEQHLPSGLYRLATNNYGEPTAVQLELRSDEMCNFKHGPLTGVMKEIDTFWGSGEHYKKLGVSHKRGILLYGPPGCGKTGIISVLIEDTIERNGLAFQVDDISDFAAGIKLARQIEPSRPIVAVIEDIESIIEYDEELLLEVMDGASSLGNGMLFVATTNHLNKIPPRVRCRPSRIDTLLEIGFPDKEQRFEYLKFVLAKTNTKGMDKQALDWAEKTQGFSLASLKELVISVLVYQKDVQSSIQRLQELAKVKEE